MTLKRRFSAFSLFSCINQNIRTIHNSLNHSFSFNHFLKKERLSFSYLFSNCFIYLDWYLFFCCLIMAFTEIEMTATILFGFNCKFTTCFGETLSNICYKFWCIRWHYKCFFLLIFLLNFTDQFEINLLILLKSKERSLTKIHLLPFWWWKFHSDDQNLISLTFQFNK